MLVLGILVVLVLSLCVLFLSLVRNDRKVDRLNRCKGKGFGYVSNVFQTRAHDRRFALPTAILRLNVDIRIGTFFKKWQSPYRCSEFNLRC